jgi:hypothetical protein
MNKILEDLHIYQPEKNNLLKNLLKKPIREPRDVMPHTFSSKPYAIEQADLLHLPDDDGYKYLLVVVDIATRRCDAQPIKTRSAEVVKKALQTIFRRGKIKQPLRLEVDDGSEFKGAFKDFFQNHFYIVSKIPARHRQQSVVETKNYQIGKILNSRMLTEEINNNVESVSWVDIVPKVIDLVNQYLSITPMPINPELPPKTNPFTSELLKVGQRVRVQLDNPVRFVDGKKLFGKFRTGDIRWSKEGHTITQIYINPNQPPMYQVDNDTRVAYTKYQLQPIHENEVRPTQQSQRKFVVKQLLQRIKKKNKIYFKVLWDDGSITEEPRTSLMKDIPLLIQQFEEA